MIQHKLTIMRMKETGSKDFRELLNSCAPASAWWKVFFP